MTFEKVVDQAIAMLQRRGRVAYGLLKRQFNLDDDALQDLDIQAVFQDESSSQVMRYGSKHGDIIDGTTHSQFTDIATGEK